MSKKENNSLGGGRRKQAKSDESPDVITSVSDREYVKNFISMLRKYDDVTRDRLPRQSLGQYLQHTTENINLYDTNIDELPEDVVNRLARTLNHRWFSQNIWSRDGLHVNEPGYTSRGKKRYLRIYKTPQRDYHPSQHDSLKISSYQRRSHTGYITSGYPGGRAISSELGDNLRSILTTINRELSEEIGFTIQLDNLKFPRAMTMDSQLDENTDYISFYGNTFTGGIKLGIRVRLTASFNPATTIQIDNTAVTISYNVDRYVGGSFYLNIGLAEADYTRLQDFIGTNFTPEGRTETMDVMMEKYLKYKNKYLQLKKILENQKN